MTEPELRLRDDAIDWRAVGDEIVVLDHRTATYLAVNEVGAAVWPLLAAGTTRTALIRAVLDRFVVDEATAERDLAAFLQRVRDAGLLRDG